MSVKPKKNPECGGNAPRAISQQAQEVILSIRPEGDKFPADGPLISRSEAIRVVGHGMAEALGFGQNPELFIDRICELRAERDGAFEDSRAPELFKTGPSDNPLSDLGVATGRIVVIGGRPGSGKTTLALQLLIDALRNQPDALGICASVGLSAEDLEDRAIARLSGVPDDRVGENEESLDRYGKAFGIISGLRSSPPRLEFLSAPFETKRVGAMAAIMQADWLAGKPAGTLPPPLLAVIDSLPQFTAIEPPRAPGKNASAVMEDLRRMSAAANIGFLAIAGSGEIERSADVAYFLRPREDKPGVIDLRCVKNRYGACHSLRLRSEPSIHRFTYLEG